MNDELRIKQEKAYGYAIYLLSLKLRTAGEIKEKLRVKGYELLIADEIILRLKENRYLDDESYAQVYLDNLKKYKTFGYYGIKKKLMEKLLPSNIIEKVLNESLNEEEELKIAKRFLQKHELGSMSRKAGSASGGTYEEKQKLAQKLKARGFRMGVISKLLF